MVLLRAARMCPARAGTAMLPPTTGAGGGVMPHTPPPPDERAIPPARREDGVMPSGSRGGSRTIRRKGPVGSRNAGMEGRESHHCERRDRDREREGVMTRDFVRKSGAAE